MYEHYHYNPTNPFPLWPPATPSSGDPDPDRWGCLAAILSWLITIVLLGILFAFTSCTAPRTILVETVRTDTLTLTQVQRDSIFIHTAQRDSVALTQRGDTILIDRWHTHTLTEYRDRWLHDSIYVATHDTIPVVVEVPKEVKVEKPLTRWQRFRLSLANIMLFTLAIYAAIFALRKRTWWLRFFKRN